VLVLLERWMLDLVAMRTAYLMWVFSVFFLKVRSLITVTGKAVDGSLPDPMNLLVTTENTQGTARSSARGVTEHFPGQTTSPYT